MHFAETRCGFEWGPATITRVCSDKKKGWVILQLKTPKHNDIQLYVTKTGKFRVWVGHKEWRPE